MLNGLWLGMVVIAVLVGAAAGRLREVTDGAFAMADLAVMAEDTRKVRGERPHVFTDLLRHKGVAEVVAFIEREGGLGPGGT